jgi:hypothetical protein
MFEATVKEMVQFGHLSQAARLAGYRPCVVRAGLALQAPGDLGTKNKSAFHQRAWKRNHSQGFHFVCLLPQGTRSVGIFKQNTTNPNTKLHSAEATG